MELKFKFVSMSQPPTSLYVFSCNYLHFLHLANVKFAQMLIRKSEGMSNSGNHWVLHHVFQSL